ncbi:hypothetical protein [Sinorhizobium meliloti]|nr:hypothetical protein [Sinorhizobium meliloti]
MGETPWRAGMSLMAFDSLEAWQRVATWYRPRSPGSRISSGP